MDSSILRLSAAYAQEEVFFSPNNIFSPWSTFFLYLNQSELQNIMSTVLIVKEKKRRDVLYWI